MGYGVGLIGCGNIAGTWVKAVSGHADCNLNLVFDLDRDAAQKRADESGARAIGELEEMLASVEIDLVVIGTPTPSHPDLVVQAAAEELFIVCPNDALSWGVAGYQLGNLHRPVRFGEGAMLTPADAMVADMLGRLDIPYERKTMPFVGKRYGSHTGGHHHEL